MVACCSYQQLVLSVPLIIIIPITSMKSLIVDYYLLMLDCIAVLIDLKICTKRYTKHACIFLYALLSFYVKFHMRYLYCNELYTFHTR